MKAIEQYFPLVLFIMLHKVIPRCNHSNKLLTTALDVLC